MISESADRDRAVRKAADRVRHLVRKKGLSYPIAISKVVKELPLQLKITSKDISHNLNPPKKRIKWLEPNFEKEADEYFDNDPTRRYFAKMGYSFKNEEELIDFLKNGKSIELDKRSISPSINITTDIQDFKNELNDPNYEEGYDKMRKELDDKGKIEMYSPIIIRFPNVYYGFAGNRRSNLSWNNGITVKFWVVHAKDKSPKQQSLF